MTAAPYVLADSVGPLGVRRVTVALAPPALADAAARDLATLRSAYSRQVLTVELDGRALLPPVLTPLLSPLVAPPPAVLPAFGWHRPAPRDADDVELHLGRTLPPGLLALVRDVPAVARWPRPNTLDLLTAALVPAVPQFGGPLVLALASAGRLAEPERHLDPDASDEPADLTDAVISACLLWLRGAVDVFGHVAVALGPPHVAARAWAPLGDLLAPQPATPSLCVDPAAHGPRCRCRQRGLELVGQVRYPEAASGGCVLTIPVATDGEPPPHTGDPDPCA